MRFFSKPVDEHVEVPVADDGRLGRVVAHWTDREQPHKSANRAGNACFVLSVAQSADPAVRAAQLEEITGLVDAQGDRVVGRESYRVERIEPRTWIGPGVAERVGREALDLGADMLVVDAELSPSQTRNLEEATGLPVCDREAVILNVFERHAKSPRARIQVEIAHLQYLRPRIRGIGLNMDQQAGGVMGSRGAGETASELFARQIDHRLADLARRLERLEESDSAQRKRRAACKRIVLVGYTNAGKTSLMNGLTSAQLSVRNRPFETLDTTTRSLTRHGGDVLISDTVGFIRRLPERLFASFASTMAELEEASLLVVVVDVSDAERAQHLAETRRILERLGAQEIPVHVVFTKADKVVAMPPASELGSLSGGASYSLLATSNVDAVNRLKEELLQLVRRGHVQREVFVRYEHGAIVQSIYASCRVLRSTATQNGTQFLIEGDELAVKALVESNRRLRR